MLVAALADRPSSMASNDKAEISPVAVSTTLEDDFVSPLTAVRGSLEVLRDTPNLAGVDRERFIDIALRACSRLEQAVGVLAKTVYAPCDTKTAEPDPARRAFLARMDFLDELQVLDLDFSDYLFDNSQAVHSFFDAIDAEIERTGRQWRIVVNFRNCKIWPEAWVAYAHRGKRVNTLYALASVRYAATDDDAPLPDAAKRDGFDSAPFPSRDMALAHIVELGG
jgi:hypothetical protein